MTAYDVVKILSTDGPVERRSDELTFIEHETVISHWEAVAHALHERGRIDDAGLQRRLDICQRNRDALFAGLIPYKEA
jgi:hypothetical protein